MTAEADVDSLFLSGRRVTGDKGKPERSGLPELLLSDAAIRGNVGNEHETSVGNPSGVLGERELEVHLQEAERQENVADPVSEKTEKSDNPGLVSDAAVHDNGGNEQRISAGNPSNIQTKKNIEDLQEAKKQDNVADQKTDTVQKISDRKQETNIKTEKGVKDPEPTETKKSSTKVMKLPLPLSPETLRSPIPPAGNKIASYKKKQNGSGAPASSSQAGNPGQEPELRDRLLEAEILNEKLRTRLKKASQAIDKLCEESIDSKKNKSYVYSLTERRDA